MTNIHVVISFHDQYRLCHMTLNMQVLKYVIYGPISFSALTMVEASYAVVYVPAKHQTIITLVSIVGDTRYHQFEEQFHSKP